jgi:hypothetical protein
VAQTPYSTTIFFVVSGSSGVIDGAGVVRGGGMGLPSHDVNEELPLPEEQRGVLGGHPNIKPVVILLVQSIKTVVETCANFDDCTKRQAARACDESVKDSPTTGRDERITGGFIRRGGVGRDGHSDQRWCRRGEDIWYRYRDIEDRSGRDRCRDRWRCRCRERQL